MKVKQQTIDRERWDRYTAFCRSVEAGVFIDPLTGRMSDACWILKGPNGERTLLTDAEHAALLKAATA